MHIPLCHRMLKAQSHTQFENLLVTFKLTIQQKSASDKKKKKKKVTFLLKPSKPLRSRPQPYWVEVHSCLILHP